VTIIAGRGENTITWPPVLDATSYDVTWWLNAGEPLTATVTGTAFRHAGLLTCLTADPGCPEYSYTVTASSSSTPSATVGAVSIPFQPFAPLITNATRVILTGLKPTGTSLSLTLNNEVKDKIVLPSRDTGWEYPVDLLRGLNTLEFVAIDGTNHVSAAASYQITLDTDQPAPPTRVETSCAAPAVGPPRVTLAGEKAASTAIVLIDPANLERLVVGTDDKTTWTATVELSWGVTDPTGDTTFNIVAKNIAGNASLPPTLVTTTVTCP
jgi:hypothetical protein